MPRPPTEPARAGPPPHTPDTTDLLESMESDITRAEQADGEGRARRAAGRPPRRPGSMRKTTRKRKSQGIGADYEVPFAGGLVALHRDHAPRTDDGLIAVSTALHDEDKRLLKEGYWFWYEEADRVCNFIESSCKHYQGELAGQLIRLERHQRCFIRRLFGWMRKDGTRRYTEAFKFVPRKNGKTLEAAAIEVILTGADGEPGAVVLSAANSKEQGKLCFDAARNMIDGSEELTAHFEVRTSYMECDLNGGILKVIIGQPGDGDNPHGAVIDEYHEAKTSKAYDAIKTGMGARRQPLLLTITTAGTNIGGPCYKLWEYAQRVFYGLISAPHFLPILFEAPEDADWRDPDVWALANPNLGVSVNADKLREQARDAGNKPDELPAFLTKRLNVWTNAVHTWMNMGRWRACAAKIPGRLEDYADRECYNGLDLAQTQDLCANVFLFPWDDATRETLTPAVLRRTGGEGYDLVARFYLPADDIDDKEHRDKVPYRKWAKDGWLTLTPGDATDYDFIKQDYLRAAELLRLKDCGYDKQFAESFASDLVNNHGVPMTRVMQSFDEMTPCVQKFEILTLRGGIRHNNNPVLNWCVSNTVMRVGARGGKMPDKRPDKGSRGRIDGVPASLMALHRAMVQQQQGTAATGVDWVD